MKRWFGNIVTSLVVLALTSFLAALLKGPIDDLANPHRLKAEVQLVPWYQQPEMETSSKPKPLRTGDKAIDAAIDAEQQLVEAMRSQASSAPSANDYQFARVIITNEGDKPVTNANVRLDAPYTPDSAVIVDAKGGSTSFKKIDRLQLPDLNPGDRITLYLWSNYFNSYTFPKAFRTYSSAGKFQTSYDWPRGQQQEYTSAVARFIDDWAVTIVIGCGVFLGLMFWISSEIEKSYYRALLASEKFYWKEKERYDEGPKSFSPDYTKINEVSKKSA